MLEAAVKKKGLRKTKKILEAIDRVREALEWVSS
jgi:hypothetical protein